MGLKIHYHVEGEGKPVVMLHGLGCDHRLMMGCMEPVFKRYSGYKRFYIDLPGMGKSEASLDYASSDKILEVLISIIDEQIKGGFLLAGESYGGYLARGILESKRLGDRVEGLLLLCPVVVPEHHKRNTPERNVTVYDEDFLSRLAPEDRESFCKYAVAANPYTYERFKKEAEPGLKIANKEFIDRLEENYAFSFDVDQRISEKKFSKPTLFLAGRQDDCVGYEDLWKLLKDYPRASFSLLDMAGHNLQFEQPEVLNCLVDQWLERIEEEL
ncbi:MAG: alpha/beta hydrolase [Eubacteriales bacterium]|nr:alpha/beta hydrolase [Eubacteriales bacterium]